MDVVLDANAYLSDPRMAGVASRILLDYLRKTESNLIIPKVVLDEVIARYPERIAPHVKRAISEVASLRGLILKAKIRKIPDIDVIQETRALKRKLRKPSEHVKSVLLSDFDKIRIGDVARRGIERKPPANPAGEELRDVISWLMVLDYASRSKREVAFITADKDFMQEGKLHPQLAAEIQEKKVMVHFHTSIDEFIKAHGPAPHELDANQAFDLLGKSTVMDRFEIEARAFFPNYWRGASTREVLGRDVRFLRGALYDVGQTSAYGEVEFAGELEVRVTTLVSSYMNINTDLSLNAPLISYQPQISYITPPMFGPSVSNMLPMSSLLEPQYNLGNADYGTLITNRYAGPLPDYGISAESRTSDHKLSGELVLSMRLVSGKVVRLETERFKVVAAEPIRR